jgi:hypothetical protein
MTRWIEYLFPALCAAILILPGCNEDPVPTCDPCPPKIYADPTAPESVLVDLQIAYRRRDIKPYAALLAPEFTFTFIPTDVQDLGLSSGTWNKSEDSTGTGHLFGATQVSAIRAELTFSPAVADTESGHPPGSMWIRVTQTALEVDQTDGITWTVTEPQDFFFRSGNPSAGEDPSHWFLLEWRDLDQIAFAPRLTPEATAVRATTWGQMKVLYKN